MRCSREQRGERGRDRRRPCGSSCWRASSSPDGSRGACGRAAADAGRAARDLFLRGPLLPIDGRDAALRTPLRGILDREFGGFALDTPGPGGRHDPVSVRAVLLEDASDAGDVISLRAAAQAVRLSGRWHEVSGGITLSVSGRVSASLVSEWRAGRRVEMPVTLRRPARYLNEGVPDFERDLALDGTTLFGSVKSGLLVNILSRGTVVQEAAARVRAHVRQSLGRWVAPHDAVSAAIVTAVLIGDRTGLPDDIRLRLQAAGTYHVIAISGGNIAILAGLMLVLLLLCGVTGRPPRSSPSRSSCCTPRSSPRARRSGARR